MRPWFFRIVLCLVLGSLTMLAVSGGAAWWVATGDFTATWHKRFDEDTYSVTQIRVTNFSNLSTVVTIAHHDWSDRPDTFATRYAEWVQFQKSDPALFTPKMRPSEAIPYWVRRMVSEPGPPYSSRIVCALGWPFRSSWCEQYQIVDGPAADWSGRCIVPFKSQGKSRKLWLPYLPLWPGLLMNVLLYGSIWFGVLFGLTSTRRAIRRRRGRCPKCAYDLGHNLEPGCPECGWGREANVDQLIASFDIASRQRSQAGSLCPSDPLPTPVAHCLPLTLPATQHHSMRADDSGWSVLPSRRPG